jgi:hypothetical protein
LTVKQNIVTVLLLLVVVGVSGVYGSWKNQQTPMPEGNVTPAVETVAQAPTAEASSSPLSQTLILNRLDQPVTNNARLGVLRLGDTRKEVEALHRSSGLTRASFAQGLRGDFPKYPGEIGVVAYDSDDKVVAIRGVGILTLADGKTTLAPGLSFSEVEKILGPGARGRGEQNFPLLNYPALGLSFGSSALNELKVSWVDLTFPWTAK